MALRLASQDTTKITIGEDPEDYIVVRKNISRRQFKNLLSTLPRGAIEGDSIDFVVASDFAEGLFVAFVTDWSAQDDNGHKIKPTPENYNELDRDSAQLIDTAISEHFNSLTPSAQEQDKSEDASVQPVDGA